MQNTSRTSGTIPPSQPMSRALVRNGRDANQQATSGVMQMRAPLLGSSSPAAMSKGVIGIGDGFAGFGGIPAGAARGVVEDLDRNELEEITKRYDSDADAEGSDDE